jgi:hypothetical protein
VKPFAHPIIVPLIMYNIGKAPQEIKNFSPTGKASADILFGPVNTSIWRGIRIAKAIKPAMRSSELKSSRNALTAIQED